MKSSGSFINNAWIVLLLALFSCTQKTKHETITNVITQTVEVTVTETGTGTQSAPTNGISYEPLPDNVQYRPPTVGDSPQSVPSIGYAAVGLPQYVEFPQGSMDCQENREAEERAAGVAAPRKYLWPITHISVCINVEDQVAQPASSCSPVIPASKPGQNPEEYRFGFMKRADGKPIQQVRIAVVAYCRTPIASAIYTEMMGSIYANGIEKNKAGTNFAATSADVVMSSETSKPENGQLTSLAAGFAARGVANQRMFTSIELCVNVDGKQACTLRPAYADGNIQVSEWVQAADVNKGIQGLQIGFRAF